ncbi:MAG: ABC-F family ATP-binding cassette domain-containing protein [Flavobacteriia bacterium]|nr:ABC-F family ATP-binding cassette domain-containing protein [Flavobacteriia bacterium]
MINLEQLGVHLPQGYLFQGINVQINKGDKIGLAGKNGAGKSTLLKLISGKDNPTEGKVHRPKDVVIGYLTQDIKIDTDLSVFEFLNQSNETLTILKHRIEEINQALTVRTDYESDDYLGLLDELSDLNHKFNLHEGFMWEEKISSALRGLGFSDYDFTQTLNSFSGGWKMRAELARILVNQPDIILLDEPTNHLDIISISWLENYLQRFEGAVIVISHDRLFLDNVTKRTLELSQGRLLDFPYAYSKYKIVREEELERLGDAKKQQDKDIKQTKELIDKFRAKKNKAAFAQSLIKKLEKTERIEVENDSVSGMKIAFPLSVQPGKWVLEMHDMGKSYGDRVLFRDINLTVGRGEKIALLGANGVGKSTLLKRIMSKVDGDGIVNYGHNVQITYFAQDQAEGLDINKTIYETVDDVAIGEIRKDLRSILGAFLFTGEDVDKKVGVLSGGERARLALCLLLLSPSNFLIFDEPTNHLDIKSKEVLKNALLNYEGTFIVVSHDREFLDGLTNRIWDIEDKTLKIHHFDVQEFLRRKMDIPEDGKLTSVSTKQKEETQAPIPIIETKQTLSFEEQKEIKRKKNQYNNQVKKAEENIAIYEKKIKELDEIIANLDYSDEAKSNAILTEYEIIKKKLDEEMINWETATEELMTLE